MKNFINYCTDGEIDLNYGDLQLNWHEDTPDEVELGVFETDEDGTTYTVLGSFPVEGIRQLLKAIDEENN